MDNDARRDNVLKAARSLMAKDGGNFTLAAVCKKARLRGPQLRRIFPTKMALLSALDEKIIVELPVEMAELEIAHEDEAVHEETVEQPNTVLLEEPMVPEAPVAPEAPVVPEIASVPTDIDGADRRFRVLQRAISLLETRVDAIAAEQARYAIERPNTDAGNAFADAPHVSAPSNAVFDEPQAEPVAPAASDAILPPVIEEPVFNPPPVATNITRGMLDSVRASVHIAAERNVQLEKSESKSNRLTLIGAMVILIVGFVIGLIWVGGSARATRTAFGTASETLASASGITIINATGSAVVDQMTPLAQAMTARAEKGDAGAQAELAMAYLRGDGVVSNPVAAAGWAGLAAVKGQPLGQFILGTLYDSGIKPDPRMGFRWMSAAALNGNVKAMHNVAVALVSGSGIEKNPGEAANWFNKAASLGYRDSAFDLAVLYERGEGVAQSTQRALYWYDKAAAAGDKESAQRASLLRFGVPEIAGNLDMSGRNRVSRR